MPLRQARVLFFSYDGAGLGHLRRLCHLAGALQGDCACLVVTGQRYAASLVPAQCEFVHLPSLDALVPGLSAYWNRDAFMRIDEAGALTMRRRLIDAVCGAFEPDLFVTDYLPLGKRRELGPLLKSMRRCLKYFVLRGVVGDLLDREEVFRGAAGAALRSHYDRLLVACDERVIDVADEYALDRGIASRLSYVGYVTEPFPAQRRRRLRAQRGLAPDDRWLVCSAGGGMYGERHMRECIRIGARLAARGVFVDCILGPRSSIVDAELVDGRLRIMHESHMLPSLHASADVIVCSAGYNSLLESLRGRARILAYPRRAHRDAEQHIHAARLMTLMPERVRLVRGELEHEIMRAIAAGPLPPLSADALDLNGASAFAAIARRDLRSRRAFRGR